MFKGGAKAFPIYLVEGDGHRHAATGSAKRSVVSPGRRGGDLRVGIAVDEADQAVAAEQRADADHFDEFQPRHDQLPRNRDIEAGAMGSFGDGLENG